MDQNKDNILNNTKPIGDTKYRAIKAIKIFNYVITSLTIALLLSTFIWGLVLAISSSNQLTNFGSWKIIWILEMIFSSLCVCFNLGIGVVSYIKPNIFDFKYKRIITISSICIGLVILSNIFIGISFIKDEEAMLLKQDSLALFYLGLSFSLVNLILITINTFIKKRIS